MKKEQKVSQEEKCPSYNAVSHTQMGVQVPIVLIFSSMVFRLEKPLNQRKAHKRQCDSLPHFIISVCLCTYSKKSGMDARNARTFSFSFSYVEVLDPYTE